MKESQSRDLYNWSGNSTALWVLRILLVGPTTCIINRSEIFWAVDHRQLIELLIAFRFIIGETFNIQRARICDCGVVCGINRRTYIIPRNAHCRTMMDYIWFRDTTSGKDTIRSKSVSNYRALSKPRVIFSWLVHMEFHFLPINSIDTTEMRQIPTVQSILITNLRWVQWIYMLLFGARNALHLYQKCTFGNKV